jgi:6-pyruvoyltetrahydropterin/6-carboxytetrahydropterin synthase
VAFISKSYRFEASHHLPNHYGKCRAPHGHSYLLEVVARGAVQDPFVPVSSAGMVVDFGELDEIVKPLIAHETGWLDHHDLNETLASGEDGDPCDHREIPVTTAEMVATWIYGRIIEHASARGIKLLCVRLWETATSYAEVNQSDWENWCVRRDIQDRAALSSEVPPAGY